MTYYKPATRSIPIRETPSTFREPTLDEILSDSIVTALMQADAVDPEELAAMLKTIARIRHADAPARPSA